MTPEEKQLTRELLAHKHELQMASLKATELAARELAIIRKERQKHDELEGLLVEYAVLVADHELYTGFAYREVSEIHQSGPHSSGPSGSSSQNGRGSNNPSTRFEREDSPGDAVQKGPAEQGQWCFDSDGLPWWVWHSWSVGTRSDSLLSCVDWARPSSDYPYRVTCKGRRARCTTSMQRASLLPETQRSFVSEKPLRSHRR